MSASFGLYRLQQVDRQIDRSRARLDAIRKTLENDLELKTALTRFHDAQAANHRATSDLKNAEAEVEAQRIKIEQTEASLYSGHVKNPKELQDLQKEVASLKKHLSTLEERELEAMAAAEDAGAEFQKVQAEFEVIQARLGNEHKNLIDEQAKLLNQLETFVREREAALAPIPMELLAAYEDLRKQKRGVAVSEVEDDACASCGTTLNASIQQNARSQKQLIHCPSCGRILFAK
jgi:predicted  nucleic acid-binding Zn-ribbon protein